jgi:hypothetical protein
VRPRFRALRAQGSSLIADFAPLIEPPSPAQISGSPNLKAGYEVKLTTHNSQLTTCAAKALLASVLTEYSQQLCGSRRSSTASITSWSSRRYGIAVTCTAAVSADCDAEPGHSPPCRGEPSLLHGQAATQPATQPASDLAEQPSDLGGAEDRPAAIVANRRDRHFVREERPVISRASLRSGCQRSQPCA